MSSNLPAGCTEEMVDAQCSPIRRNYEDCFECGCPYVVFDMFPWNKFDTIQRRYRDVYICPDCVKQSYSCQWLHDPKAKVNIDLKPCGRIQSPNAQGPWCAEHNKEAELLSDIQDLEDSIHHGAEHELIVDAENERV